ncbi:MAG: questin oxidase family protein [Cyclobacteriaceae bacterium]
MTDKEFLNKIDVSANNIVGRIDQVFNSHEFINRLGPLNFGNDDPMKSISKEIMNAFEKIHDFTLLHGVTSCHAIRILLPFIPDQKQAVTEFFYSLCAAYVSVLKMRTEINNLPLPEYNNDEESLKTKAIKSMNEHTIKLTYTCFKEYEMYKRPEYLQLITREVQSPALFK